MPIINETLYAPIRLLIYFVYAIYVFFVVIKQKLIIRNKFYFIFLLTVIYSVLVSIINLDTNFLQLLIPFMILIASYEAILDWDLIKKITSIFIGLTTLLSISSVFYYVGGFVITQTYSIPAKNQIGPMIALAIVISYFLFNNSKYLGIGLFTKWLCIISFFFNILAILVIRNRAGLLALGIVFFLDFFRNKLFVKYFSYKQIILVILIFMLIIYLLLSGKLDSIYEFIWNSITLNYDTTNLQSLSAGRTETYIEGLLFALNNPVLGAMDMESLPFGTPHNYIINNIVNYGLILPIPLIAFYLYLWFFSIKNLFIKKENYDQLFFVPWMLLLTLIISLFEYTYPYGPASSQFMLWFLIGQFLRKKDFGI
ncbi:O-antigen ligase family protein [Aerococcus urinaeequi]|uniref:O-antigen ligase family protein n=1 Tax=Aerococcus urinaeequi TaxID=51665 RepID=UPI003D6A38CB